MTNSHSGVVSLEKTCYAGPREDVAVWVPLEAHRILDVGCASGELGMLLKQRSPDVEVTGVEMSPALAETAAVRLDRVLTGTIEEALPSLPADYFDCAIFADVLEHMVNPYQVLLDLRDKLHARGSTVIASIPNARHYRVLAMLFVRGRWDYYQGGLLDSGHLRFFTRASILNMFQWAGYDAAVVAVNYNARRSIWRLNRLLLRRLSPFLEYQYIVAARPIPGFIPSDEPWYLRDQLL